MYRSRRSLVFLLLTPSIHLNRVPKRLEHIFILKRFENPSTANDQKVVKIWFYLDHAYFWLHYDHVFFTSKVFLFSFDVAKAARHQQPPWKHRLPAIVDLNFVFLGSENELLSFRLVDMERTTDLPPRINNPFLLEGVRRYVLSR